MQNFNDPQEIAKIDPQDTFGSTEKLAEQLEVAWKEVSQIKITDDFSKVKNMVFCGMGASIYGALVYRALVGEKTKYPIEFVSDYHLPAYVNKDSLVVLTSYSGTTEEVLSCAQDAKTKKAKIMVLTKNGRLSEFAKENNIPSYIFDGKLNPAGVPRLGNGYTILGLLGLLLNAGLIEISNDEVEKSITFLKVKTPELKQKAMQDCGMFVGTIPIIIAAEHLSGNAHIFRNQFNETSKSFSAYYLVPDLNHHLMEGLTFPKPSNLYFILLNSSNYSEKIQKRMRLTQDVIKKNNQNLFEFSTSGYDIYQDFMEILSYGSYLTFYLALLHDQNPAVNPWVDYFKDQLKK